MCRLLLYLWSVGNLAIGVWVPQFWSGWRGLRSRWSFEGLSWFQRLFVAEHNNHVQQKFVCPFYCGNGPRPEASSQNWKTCSTVTLALDGWTDFRHLKTFNFVLLWNRIPVFWKPVPFVFGKSANAMTHIVMEIIAEVETVLCVTVVAIVANNENTNKGLFSQTWQLARLAIMPWVLCSWLVTRDERHFQRSGVGR